MIGGEYSHHALVMRAKAVGLKMIGCFESMRTRITPSSCPISIITADRIAGLVGLAATTISAARNYMAGAKNAKQSIAILITELEALQSNLLSLDEFLRRSSTQGLEFHQTSVLRSCTSACESKLQSLHKKLGQAGDTRSHRYLWPLSEKEHQKTVEDLRAFAQWLQFALSVDGCSLLSRTSDDVLKILGQQLENFGALQSIEKKTSQLQKAVKDQTRMLQDDRNAERRECILNWIFKQPQDQKHQSVRPPRVGGSGSWLLERQEYVKWRDGTSTSSMFWCYGIQGSGKTVLTSMIIDELKSSSSMSGHPVAFFYFDYQDQDHTTSSYILSSILRQIVSAMPEIPKCVMDAYEKRGSGVTISLTELQQMLIDITASIDRTYIIIDALDECDEEHQRTFLQCVDRLQRIKTIRLLVTSRQYPKDIYEAFHNYPQVEIKAQDSDLRNYIYQEIEHAGVEDIIDEEFATEIVEALTRRAQGMFLLPILQLRTILKEPTAGEMEDMLASLSRNLPEAFEQTITRVLRLPESRSRLGMNVLMWLCHAKRVLQVSELSEALSVKPGQRMIRPKHCPSSKMMLDCCQGLVIIDPESMDIRLAHYSIQEYLTGQSDKLFPLAEVRIATTCLTYLLFDNFTTGPCGTEAAIRSRIATNPFLSYASSYCRVHVRASEGDDSVQKLTIALFESHGAASAMQQMQQFLRNYKEVYWNSEECDSHTPLHFASDFGLENTLLELLDQGHYSIDTCTKMGTTPLIRAASGGHVSIVRLLLQKGADPYLENWYGNALHCAAEAGHSSTIIELVRHGVALHCAAEAGHSSTITELVRHGGSPVPYPYYSRIPIYCTLDNDEATALETLIILGSDINAREENRESLFHEAILTNCSKIVDLVLRRRWVDIESKASKFGFTAMHIAVTTGDRNILVRLLEAGADINAENDQGHTPLQFANLHGNEDASRLLSSLGMSGAVSQWSIVPESKFSEEDWPTEKELTSKDLAPKQCYDPRCGKKFKRSCDLTKHEKTHSRPWKCDIAECRYAKDGWPTEKELLRHQNDRHSQPPKLYNCQIEKCCYHSKRESNV